MSQYLVIFARWVFFICVLGAASGCASRAPAEDSLGEFHGQLPSRAWVLEGTMVMRFDADPGREVYAVSSWQDAAQSTGEYSHALSRLEYVDNDWPEGLERKKAFLEIPVICEESDLMSFLAWKKYRLRAKQKEFHSP